MSVIQSIQGILQFAQVRSTGSAPEGLKPYARVDAATQTDLLRARGRLLSLHRGLEALAELANINTRFKLNLPDAQSTSGLGLDLTHTAASLSSSDEINASPMSFTPFGPDWDDGSSALITIGGEYDGSHGTGTLSFEVRRAGTHGVNDLRIRLEDPQGNRIRNINVRDHHAEDRTYDLRNGLFLTLGPGSLINRDTTTIQVYDNVGAVVDPGKPLGGIRNNNPNLQFGTPSVVDGSFLLNGENITVSTADSLTDVVDRVNQSAAGVTATFNAATERIEFLQDSLGSLPTIDLQNDTSNFLQATKLSSTNTIAGIDPETIQTFDNVAAFSGVQSGDIVINSELIAINTANDSLTSVIDRINASPAGVVASFDSASQKVLIESRNANGRLDIDSNGTGFFAAINMPEGRVDPEAVGRGISRRQSYEFADSIGAVFSELNYLFRDSSFRGPGSNPDAIRAPLESAIRSAFGGEVAADILGLQFDPSADARRRGDLMSLDRRVFTNRLQLRGNDVIDLLGGRDDTRGLLDALLLGTGQALNAVSSLLGQSGAFVDTFA